MKYDHRRIFRMAFFLTAMLSTGVWTESAAGTISLNSTPKLGSVGQSLSLNLVGAGFLENLDGGGVDITFDPSIIHISSILFDGIWDFFTSVGTIDNIGGSVTGVVFNTLQNITGNFSIATILFNVVGVGTTSLALNEYPENPFASGGDPVATSFVNGSVQATPVPLPPAASWLLASGLAGISFRVRLNQGRKS